MITLTNQDDKKKTYEDRCHPQLTKPEITATYFPATVYVPPILNEAYVFHCLE